MKNKHIVKIGGVDVEAVYIGGVEYILTPITDIKTKTRKLKIEQLLKEI